MGDILLSIIIPVYNAKEYLPECLDSIIPQIKDDSCEIVLVDDGSSDGSEIICDEYAKRYSSFVSVYHNVNHGLLYTRHYGVLKANGKYIMNCDADDFLDETALDNVISVLTKADYDVIIYNMDTVTNGEKNSLTSNIFGCEESNIAKEDVHRVFISSIDIVSMCCKVYKKSFINLDLFSECGRIGNGEDTLQSVEVYSKANTFYYINKALYNYRTQTGMTSRFDNHYLDDFSSAFGEIIDNKDVWLVKEFDELIATKIYYTLGRAITQLRYGDDLSWKAKKDYLYKLKGNNYVQKYMDCFSRIKNALPGRYRVLDEMLLRGHESIIIILLAVRNMKK